MSDKRSRRTEVQPEVVFLGKLLERVNEGKLRVPRFQRPYVWRHTDMLNLLDSILCGYPIGSILVWKTECEVSSLDRMGPISIGPHPGGIVSYILDGHQRIATLVGTLLLSDEPGPTDDNVDWRVYCDLENLEFVHAPKEGLKPRHFPVRCLLSTSKFFDACRAIKEGLRHNSGRTVSDQSDQSDLTGRSYDQGLKEQVEDSKVANRLLKAADDLANAIRNYQLPLISVSDADLDSAVTVFARLNRRGRKISADQMVSALTYREGEFHLAQHLDSVKEDLGRRGFGNLERVFLLRSVLAAMDLDIYAKDFANILVKEEIRERLPEAFEIAEKGITSALDFLEGLGVTSDRLLPYGLQLVVLADFFRLYPQPRQNLRNLLEQWFWVTSFTGWFGGVNLTKVRRALDEMRDIARREASRAKTATSKPASRDKNRPKGRVRIRETVPRFEVVNLESAAQPFPERFDARSARVRAFLLYLTSLHPQSIVDEGELEPDTLLSEHGPNALAHVVANGLPLELLSSPANRMFVDRKHKGQTIGVLENMMEDEDPRLDKLLASHGFPSEAKEHLRTGEREALVRARLECLIEGERGFLEKRHVALPNERTAPTLRDSDVSEEE